MAKGPVCGMEVDEQKAAGTSYYRGRPQTQTSVYWNYNRACRHRGHFNSVHY